MKNFFHFPFLILFTIVTHHNIWQRERCSIERVGVMRFEVCDR
jgi:hypothetical protein